MLFPATWAAQQSAAEVAEIVEEDVTGVRVVKGFGQEARELDRLAVEKQAELALRNVEAVLKAAGTDLDHVVQMTIYVSDMELWGRVNDTYAKVMGEHRPARAIVPVKDLHFDTKIEIQAIAAVKIGTNPEVADITE